MLLLKRNGGVRMNMMRFFLGLGVAATVVRPVSPGPEMIGSVATRPEFAVNTGEAACVDMEDAVAMPGREAGRRLRTP